MAHTHNPNGSPIIELDQVSIRYEGLPVVEQATLSLESGDIGCLLGPSGCGKSTLLRSIAGFEPLYAGEIRMESRPLSSVSHNVNPEDRQIGMVFQDFSLFPHLSIRENVSFGIREWSRDQQNQRIHQLLQLIGLSGFEDRYPHSLSGGEQQRVALARAIAPQPKLLLLDEPFSSLDAELREELVPEVREILLQEKVTAILVTHDQMEAFGMADQVGVMESGRIHQWATSYELYHRPQTRFVADFIGQGEFLGATVVDEFAVESALGLHRSSKHHGYDREQRVDVLIRPDDVLHDDDSELTGEIISKRFRGSHFLYSVRLQSHERVYCLADSHHNHAIGERIGITLNLDHLVMFPKERTL